MAAEKCKLVLYMFTTTLLGSHWLHMSIYCVLIIKLGICLPRVH